MRSCLLAYNGAVMLVCPFQPRDDYHRVIAKFVLHESGKAEAFGLSWFPDDPWTFDQELQLGYPLFDVEDEVMATLVEEQGKKRFVVTVGGKEVFKETPFVVETTGTLVLKWAGRRRGRGTLGCIFHGRGDLDVADYGEFASLPPLGVGDTFSVRVADWQTA